MSQFREQVDAATRHRTSRSRWPRTSPCTPNGAGETRRPRRSSWSTAWHPTSACGTASPRASSPRPHGRRARSAGSRPLRRAGVRLRPRHRGRRPAGPDQALGLSRPVLVGQSWGGNVVLEFGWRHAGAVRGVACVDGGVIELAEWFPTWDACLAALTPPRLDHLTMAELEPACARRTPDLPERALAASCTASAPRADGRIEPRLARHRHLQILRTLWEHRPSTRFPTLEPPTILVLADTGDAKRTAAKRQAEARALATAPRLRSHWFSPAPPRRPLAVSGSRGGSPGPAPSRRASSHERRRGCW